MTFRGNDVPFHFLWNEGTRFLFRDSIQMYRCDLFHVKHKTSRMRINLAHFYRPRYIYIYMFWMMEGCVYFPRLSVDACFSSLPTDAMICENPLFVHLRLLRPCQKFLRDGTHYWILFFISIAQDWR